MLETFESKRHVPDIPCHALSTCFWIYANFFAEFTLTTVLVNSKANKSLCLRCFADPVELLLNSDFSAQSSYHKRVIKEQE